MNFFLATQAEHQQTVEDVIRVIEREARDIADCLVSHCGIIRGDSIYTTSLYSVALH